MFNQKKPRGGKIDRHTPPAPPENIKARTIPGQEVEFLGWQKTISGDMFPLYNILKIGHRSHLSTVTEQTLQGLRLRVPRTPSPYPDVEPSPWHILGKDVMSPATADEAIVAAGLNFTVVKRPLTDIVEVAAPDGSDRWATVRTDTGDILGIVEESYVPIQNKDAFGFFDNLVGSGEAIYETAGMIGHGERIWILAKLPGYINVHGNDLVGKYLLLSNSHDGSGPLRVKLTPIRVVCNNTLTAALQGEGEVLLRHTTNAAEGMKQAAFLLGLSKSLYEQLGVKFNRMALTKITDKQLLAYVKAVLPVNEDGANNARTEVSRNNILALHESGKGSDFARGTLWGAYNSVTEYADHMMVDAKPSKRVESIWFGKGEQLKLKAFQLADLMM